MFPFRMCLYKCQLMFYFRTLDLPAWVKQVMMDHLSLKWPSPYLKYITSIRDSIHLPFVPPTPRYLDTIAQFRSNAGLGNGFPRFATAAYGRRSSFPLCPSLYLSEVHVVFFCSAVETHRKELDLTFFRNICQRDGYNEEKTFLRLL